MLCRTRLSAWFHGSPKRGTRRRARPGLGLETEALETRRLLSASGPQAPADVHVIGDGDSHDAGGDPGHRGGPLMLPGILQQLGEFELTIVGTAIEYDPATGLPQHIEGDVFYVGGFLDGRPAGTYQEDVTPILHPDYGFIGVTGVSTFEFHAWSGARSPFGTLNTHYQAFIVGVDEATGAVLVQSTGTIVSGTGVFRHATGEFTSSSSVHLGFDFAMNTAVSVTLDTQQMLAAARQEWHDAHGHSQPGHSHGLRRHRDACDDLSQRLVRLDEGHGAHRGGHGERDDWQSNESRRERNDDHPRRVAEHRGGDHGLDAAFATLGRTWHA